MYPKSLQIIAGLVAGLFAGEAAVRLCTHPSLDYASIFRPGPYCEDAELGFTAACPGWSGFMATAGKNRYVPLHLNPMGYRGPYRSPGPENGPRKVVMIVGGQSQGFGFGLRDSETFPAAAAKYGSCGAYDVHSISLVGLSNTITWHLFERDVLPSYKPDHIVLAVYWREARPDISAEVLDYVAMAGKSGYAYGWRFDVPEWVPRPLRASHALVRIAGSAIEMRQKVIQQLGLTVPVPAMVPSLSNDTIDQFRTRAKALNIPFSLMILPWGAPTQDEQFKAKLKDLDVVDTHAGVWAQGLQTDALADGHYGPNQADLIGKLLAADICTVDFPK